MQHDQRFDGWKAIANFLGRERSTASRWARERGLPVHRVPGGQTGTVYALRSELDAWLASDGLGRGIAAPEIVDEEPAAGGSAQKRRGNGAVSIGIAVIFMCAAAAMWWAIGRVPAAAKTPVSIAAVASSTASPEAAAFARALTADLARFANASGDLVVYEAEPAAANTQYIVRTEIERSNDKTIAVSRLISAKDGEVLWSRRFEQVDPALSVLRDRVAANIVGVLQCSFGGLEGERAKARSIDLTQIMTICQEFEANDMTAARARAQRLTLERPDLAIGWSLLAVIHGNSIDEQNNATLLGEARANAERARQIAPDSAMTWLALTAATGKTASDPAALPMTEVALQRHRDHPWLLSQHSVILFNLGYVQASVAPAVTAYRNNPGFLYMRDVAVRRLAAAGQVADAQVLQDENDLLWPGHTMAMETRARIVQPGPALRQTDLDMIRESEKRFNDQRYEAYLLARLYERAGNRAAALAWLQRAPIKDAHQQWSLLFWPDAAGLRTEPMFFQKMAALGLVRWWVKRGQWPDFCREPGLKYSCADEAAKSRGGIAL